MYGNRYKKGGDMYEQFNKYLDWALKYDISDDPLGSKKETDKWAARFTCDVLYIDGNKNIDEKIRVVLKKIQDLNAK